MPAGITTLSRKPGPSFPGRPQFYEEEPMSTTEFDAEDHEEATALESAGPGSGARTELSPAEALERLRKGQPLENVRVERLVFRGEFPLPIRLTHCVLVRPRFDGAVFLDEVRLTACTLDRPE